MASIINNTGNTSSTSSASSIKGFGGLVSGLDRDSLINGMTAATKAKIAKQQKQKQTYAWQQEAYRSVSSKLVEFAKKYASYTNQSTNISSPAFWAKSSITAVGGNSKYISVSGSSSLSDSMSIVGVKQLARDTSMSSVGSVSDQSLTTGTINFGQEQVSTLEGQNLSFQYGNKTYTVALSSGTTKDGFTYDYSNGENTQKSITKALKNVAIGDGKTLADVLKVEADSQGTPFKLNFKSTDNAGNTIEIVGGSKTALKAFNIEDIDKLTDAQKTINADGMSSDLTGRTQAFFQPMSFSDRVAGKSISFTYNGTTKTIQFDSDPANLQSLDTIKTDLNKKLNKAFGTGRIEVSVEAGALKFKTMNPATNKSDDSSILSISSADQGVIGKTGALKMEYGESNRLNLSSSLINSGLKGIAAGLGSKLVGYETTYFSGSVKAMELIDKLGSKVTNDTTASDLKNLISSNYSQLSDTVLSDVYGAIDHFKTSDDTKVGDLKTSMNNYTGAREMKLNINGVDIKGISYNSTMSDIISKVNSSDAGVTMSYMTNSDKFSIVAKAGGAAGKINIEGNDAELLFGKKDDNYKVVDGQDLVVGVKYAGSNDVVNLVRGNNSFNLDGLNITVNGKFGYDDAGNAIAGTEAVTFNAKTDSDKIVSAVSSMIKDYNDIIKLVNDQVSTKPNRSYEPLTDDQKKGMTEDQISKWEDKAKEGLLFNDSDLRSISDSMNFIFESGSSDKSMLESFGISTSPTYGDNGKLVFDETKFRAALESNAGDLQKLFTKTADVTTGEKGGVMARITSITDKYASTTGATKGILIEKAGSVYAPTSILTNSIQKSMNSLDDYIERLQDQLKTETDRYVKQFTSLETLISQMNSQSSWLNSSSGS